MGWLNLHFKQNWAVVVSLWGKRKKKVYNSAKHITWSDIWKETADQMGFAAQVELMSKKRKKHKNLGLLRLVSRQRTACLALSLQVVLFGRQGSAGEMGSQGRPGALVAGSRAGEGVPPGVALETSPRSTGFLEGFVSWVSILSLICLGMTAY